MPRRGRGSSDRPEKRARVILVRDDNDGSAGQSSETSNTTGNSGPRVTSLNRGPPGIASVAASVQEQHNDVSDAGSASRGERTSETPDTGVSSGGERTNHDVPSKTDPRKDQCDSQEAPGTNNEVKRSDDLEIYMINDCYPDLLDADVAEDSSPAKG
eukprot:1535926-Rhodomonas_salina.1